MLDAAGSIGSDAAAEYLRLDCTADNERLTALHRAYGFAEVGRKHFPEFSATLMELPLGGAGRPEPARTLRRPG